MATGVGVLSIVDRVGIALFHRKVEIEVEVARSRTLDEEITNGILADIGDEFAVGDRLAGPFAHLDFLAIFEDPNDLNKSKSMQLSG
jgi:hypothetical protein